MELITDNEKLLLEIIEDTTRLLIKAVTVIGEIDPNNEYIDKFKKGIQINIDSLDRLRGMKG